MDYRSEVLAVWVQGGTLYARLLPGQGAARPAERLARVGAHPHIAALLSDDGRAIVAWSEQRGARTSVYIDRSGSGVRFRAAELLERFEDPDGLTAPAASPSLVRLSSESVMLAWAGASAGHWVVRTASVVHERGGTSSARSPRRERTFCSAAWLRGRSPTRSCCGRSRCRAPPGPRLSSTSRSSPRAGSTALVSAPCSARPSWSRRRARSATSAPRSTPTATVRWRPGRVRPAGSNTRFAAHAATP